MILGWQDAGTAIYGNDPSEYFADLMFGKQYVPNINYPFPTNIVDCWFEAARASSWGVVNNSTHNPGQTTAMWEAGTPAAMGPIGQTPPIPSLHIPSFPVTDFFDSFLGFGADIFPQGSAHLTKINGWWFLIQEYSTSPSTFPNPQ